MNDDEEEDNKSKEEPVDDQPNNQNVLIQDILLEVDIFAAYTQERHYKDSEIDFAREEPTPE